MLNGMCLTHSACDPLTRHCVSTPPTSFNGFEKSISICVCLGDGHCKTVSKDIGGKAHVHIHIYI